MIYCFFLLFISFVQTTDPKVIAYYSFETLSNDEKDVFNDVDDSKFEGTFQGKAEAATPPMPIFDNALKLGQSASSLVVLPKTLDFSTRGGYIALWVRATSTPDGDARIVSKAKGSSATDGYFTLSWNTQYRFRLRIREDFVANVKGGDVRNRWIHFGILIYIRFSKCFV